MQSIQFQKKKNLKPFFEHANNKTFDLEQRVRTYRRRLADELSRNFRLRLPRDRLSAVRGPVYDSYTQRYRFQIPRAERRARYEFRPYPGMRRFQVPPA